MKPRRSEFSVLRLSMDAMLIAIYIVLTFFQITVGGLKFTVESLPVVIGAALFGPVDAAIIGGLGELVDQLKTFGPTPTTILWMLPAIAQGLIIGILMMPLRKRPDYLQNGKQISASVVVFYIACMLSAVVASLLNTLAYYVDSKMFGYYEYHLVIGVMGIRIGKNMLTTVAMATITFPLMAALRRAKLIK